MTHRVLRQYIRHILAENDLGGFDMSGYGYGMGMGMGGGMYGGWEGASGEGLFKAFIEPFTDVVKTAVGETKQLVRRGHTLLRVAFETVMTTLIPILTDSYDEIFAEEKADLERIKGDYADVYARTDEALKGDAEALAFILAPGAVAAKGVFNHAPTAAASMISVLSGGKSDKYFGTGWTGPGRSGGRASPGSVFGDSKSFYGRRLDEKDDKKKKPKITSKEIAAAMNDPDVVDAIKKKTAGLRQEILEAKKNKLKAILEKSKAVLTAKTAADVAKAIGDKSAVDDAKKKVLASKDAKDMDPKQLDAIFAELPKTAGPMLQKSFLAPLEDEKKALAKAGAPEEVVKMYDQVITKISSMKAG